MGLYLDKGYLNYKYISQLVESNNIAFCVIIGARQVGKTYGCLEWQLKNDNKFILMRRTQTESDFICNDVNNPFTVYSFKNIQVKKDTKYTGAIYDAPEESDKKYIGCVMALSTVAKIRGFNGGLYTDLVFDEFIPENHVIKIKNEGDAFLNAVVTISGNRELEEKRPLRVWLLANSNNIGSPILESLNITKNVERMVDSGQELSILKDRGIMIIIPKSEKVLASRKETALAKAIKGDSEFSEMAFNNKFSYNDAENIKTINFKEYKPVFTVLGKFTLFRHKSKPEFFVGAGNYSNIQYLATDRNITQIQRQYPNLKVWYLRGLIYFGDLTVKTQFVNTFKL